MAMAILSDTLVEKDTLTASFPSAGIIPPIVEVFHRFLDSPQTL